MLKIVSGGQTGVDRAALDAALALGLSCGGWCPKGRKAEDGKIAREYPLTETPSDDYQERTKWNVRDSEGVLILTNGSLFGGTALTARFAKGYGKPFLVVDLDKNPSPDTVTAWLEEHKIGVLNIAGPRESSSPGIHDRARRFLEETLKACR